MTKQDYISLLNQFDWHYEYSDDMRVWRECFQQEIFLKDIAKQFGFTPIYEKYKLTIEKEKRHPISDELEV